MKKFKYLIIICLVVFLFSVFSITSFAEEIDYNTVIAVEIGDLYTYSNLGMNNATWSSYITAYNTKFDDSPFKVSGDFVIYKDQFFLFDRTGKIVTENDIIRLASGNVYTTQIVFSGFNVTGYELKFKDYLNGYSFNSLIEVSSSTSSSLTIGGYYGNTNVYYYGALLKNGMRNVKPYDPIDSSVVYTVSDVICTHDPGTISNIYQEPTCKENGSAQAICRACGSLITVTLEASDLYHSIVEIERLESTCISEGFVKGTCEYCNTLIVNLLPKSKHKFNVATCTEPAICSVCGYEDGSPLGHDYKAFGLGKCKNCGQNPAKDTANNVLDSVKNVFNSVGNLFKTGYDKVVDAGNDVKEDFKSTLEKITMIIGGIIVVIALIIFLPIVVKVYKKIFRKKDKTTWRGKR